MVVLFGITILSLLFFMVIKKLRFKYLEEEFRQKMFELRDDLRRLAINGVVDENCNEFRYMDFSLSKNIEQSYYISMFHLFTLEMRHKIRTENMKGYKSEYDNLMKGIVSHAHLKEIFVKKNTATRDYLLGQTVFLTFFVRRTHWMLSKVFNAKQYFVKRMSEINYFPELSGIRLYK